MQNYASIKMLYKSIVCSPHTLHPPGKEKCALNETYLYKPLSRHAKWLFIGGIKDNVMTCFYF